MKDSGKEWSRREQEQTNGVELKEEGSRGLRVLGRCLFAAFSDKGMHIAKACSRSLILPDFLILTSSVP